MVTLSATIAIGHIIIDVVTEAPERQSTNNKIEILCMHDATGDDDECVDTSLAK